MKYAITALAFIALAGCSNRNVDSLDAVKQGVIKDISKNINVAAMDVNVVSVSFRDKEADAVVSFAPKGGTAAQGLTMNYTMERKGDEWHIKSRANSDLQKHAAQAPPNGAMPGGMPSTDMPGSPHGAMAPGSSMPGAMNGQSLPPGHPTTTQGGAAGGQQLPPDHPPLDSIKK